MLPVDVGAPEVRQLDDPAMDSTRDLMVGGKSSFTRPSVRSGEHGEIGCRQSMEDASICMEGVEVEGYPHGPVAFYGIFDGHGGCTAAEFVKGHLVSHITSDPSFIKDPTTALRDAFRRTDSDLRAAREEEDCSGSTALCICLRGCELIVANTGDSRAVLSRRGKAVDLSTDQRPTCSTEQARIEQAGGFVEDGYINGHLGVARAFGDFHLEELKGDPEAGRPGPLIVDPEVELGTLTEEDEFLIIACDGLWDVFSSQNAVDFTRAALRRHNDAKKAARELTEQALERHSADNVSVIVVCLADEAPPDRVQEKRWAPRGNFSRAISIEGLSEIQKAIKSDDEAERITPKLQRVSSINPSTQTDGEGLGAAFIRALDIEAVKDNIDSGDGIEHLSPVEESPLAEG